MIRTLFAQGNGFDYYVAEGRGALINEKAKCCTRIESEIQVNWIFATSERVVYTLLQINIGHYGEELVVPKYPDLMGRDLDGDRTPGMFNRL